MTSAPLCFLDTETDGIHPARRPWEVALIRREPDGTETTAQMYLPINLATADPFGLRVGRFYDRHPLGRRLSHPPGTAAGKLTTADTAARTIARMTHGAHIVGAVPSFDTETLAPYLREHGYTPAWHYHLVDVENLAVGYLAGQGAPVHPPYSTDGLTEALGLDPSPPELRHTALGDTHWARAVYDRIIGGPDA